MCLLIDPQTMEVLMNTWIAEHFSNVLLAVYQPDNHMLAYVSISEFANFGPIYLKTLSADFIQLL